MNPLYILIDLSLREGLRLKIIIKVLVAKEEAGKKYSAYKCKNV